MNAQVIARACHEMNRAWCALWEAAPMPSWDDAPQWQRDSALAGVDFHLAHPGAKPYDSHNSWLEVKRAEGWAYGRVKDLDRKLHPCFVPYEDLPPLQRAKDDIFVLVVNALRGGL